MRSLSQTFAMPDDAFAAVQPQSAWSFATSMESLTASTLACPGLQRVSRVLRTWLPLASGMPLWVADMPTLNRMLGALETNVEMLSLLAALPDVDQLELRSAIDRLCSSATQLDRFLRDSAAHASTALIS
jgi:hypothetical protein